MGRPGLFTPGPALLQGTPHPDCHVGIVVPAHNEEVTLARCLEALSQQRDLQGTPLAACGYEVLVLLNNCTDGSAEVAQCWKQEHPDVALHLVERTLPPEEAHAGSARRLLMDTAWHRLHARRGGRAAILSTDADTVVAPDWVAQNLRALATEADLIGGCVHVLAEELRGLPPFVRRCYERNRQYAALVAQLEDALDPQPGDRCPRHLDHFGSSLACTAEAYARAGGMPLVRLLEDEAFVDQARHANLRLRHEPAVCVYTSARLKGRAAMGLAGQFRQWQQMPDEDAHRVPSTAFLEHRFRTMHRLRTIFRTGQLGDLALPTNWWRCTFAEALREQTDCPGFLGAVYCNILISESFEGSAEEPIAKAIAGLERLLASLSAPTRRTRASRVAGQTRSGSSTTSVRSEQGSGSFV